MTVKATGGGRFDPADEQVYFLAGVPLDYHDRALVDHNYVLIAMNDLFDDGNVKRLRTVIDRGAKVLLDSGIFWLTNRHARDHDVRMDDALKLHPDEIDGFQKLWDRYTEIVADLEPDLWGYIELDQGGAERKRETRARLEDFGLAPIPVYHPFADGWDYFDELCEQYDRICFGNIVQASYVVRKHLMATLWERRRRYPHVWVHVLGLTQNAITTVYPPSSCDSSSLAYLVRFGVQNVPGPTSMNATFSRYPTTFNYAIDAGRYSDIGHDQGVHLGACDAVGFQRNLRRQSADLRDVFGDDATLPEPNELEEVRS